MIFLSHLHPRLFHSLILIEPSMNATPPDQGKVVGNINIKYAVFRKDLWPSRSEAAASLGKNPIYRSWDP